MPKIHNHERRLKAAEMIKKVVLEGKTKKQTGKEMGVSHDTVERTLSWAREANIFLEFEQRLFTELLPLAHETVKLAIEDGDAQVALKIFEFAGLSGKDRGKSKSAQEHDEGLYGEIAKIKAQQVIDITPRRELPAGEPTGGEEWVVSYDPSASGVHGIKKIPKVKSPDRFENVNPTSKGN